MESRRRTSLVGGVILVLAGILFLLVQLNPQLRLPFDIVISWPLIVAGVGVFLLLFGILVNAPGMAVPACIVGGIGAILYYQNLTGDWASWAYAWTLIPGLAGVGSILAGLLGGKFRQSLRDGGGMIIISVIMFAIFSSFLGGPKFLGVYWPVLIILLGVWLLIRPFLR